jgi:acyl dehydratase
MEQPISVLRDPVFEAVQIGELIGPFRVVADERYARQAMFALDEFGPWYVNSLQEVGCRIVPAAKVVCDLMSLFCSVYDPNLMMGLHQREEAWFHGPISLGTAMLYCGRFIEKYKRRGKGYVVFESEARDEATGALLVRQVSTEIMRVPENVRLGEGSANPAEERRVKGVWPADRAPVDRARRDIKPGTPIPSITKIAHQDQMAVFSGCDLQWRNIHTDVDYARKGGYRDTLAAGLMETCWICEMVARFFGPTWLTTGHIHNVYLKPVFRGDIITCRGVVTSTQTDSGETRLELEVWAENQDNLMTAAGWASARVAV